MKPISNPPDVHFVKIREVIAISRLSRASIYNAIKKGTFPAQVKLGVRASAWIRSEIVEWTAKKVRESREMGSEEREK